MASQLSPPVFHPGGVGRNFCGEELGYARMARVRLKHDEVYNLYISSPKPFAGKLHSESSRAQPSRIMIRRAWKGGMMAVM